MTRRKTISNPRVQGSIPAAGRVVALVLALVVAAPATAAPPKSIGTLTIDGLADQPSPVFSFAAGGSSGSPGAGGGGGGGSEAGKFSFATFGLTKPIDAMSPKLLEATTSGEVFPEARIDLTILKGVRPTAMTIILSDARIAADALSDAGEVIAIAFTKIREIAHTPDGDVETCFDFTTAKKLSAC